MVHVLSSDAAQVQAEGWSPGRISAYSKGENEEVKIVITTTKPANSTGRQMYRASSKTTRAAQRNSGKPKTKKPSKQSSKILRSLTKRKQDLSKTSGCADKFEASLTQNKQTKQANKKNIQAPHGYQQANILVTWYPAW